MKRISLILITFFALTGNALANGYCDGRGNQYAVEQCYRSNIEAKANMLTQTYQRLYNSPSVTPQQRQGLYENQRQWEDAVRMQCRDSSCVEQAYYERNLVLMAELRRLPPPQQYQQQQRYPAQYAPQQYQQQQYPRY